jgi:hypothetical protein
MLGIIPERSYLISYLSGNLRFVTWYLLNKGMINYEVFVRTSAETCGAVPAS